MDDDKLLKLGKPCFYLTVLDDSAFANLYLELTAKYRPPFVPGGAAAQGTARAIPSVAVRTIRGRKSTTVPNFFNEVGAALQFPYYFGENWNAFSECITDMDWLEAGGYLLLVSEARLLLSEADVQDFNILAQTFEQANEEWLSPNQYIPRDRPPTPFHVVLQVTEADLAVVSQRLSQAGVEFAQI